jgi:hypothetical protein
MKRLYQALDEATDTQLQDVLRLWSLDGDANEAEARPGLSFTVGRHAVYSNDSILISKVQDPIAARFVWEGLSENERLLLHKMVAAAGRSGVPFETMLKRTAWTEDQLERVAFRLEYYLLIQQQEEDLSKWQYRYSSDLTAKKQPTTQKVRILYPFRESESNLFTVGKEILSERGSHAGWSLEELLASLMAGQLQQIIMRYGIKLDFYHAKSKLAELLSKHLMEMGDPLAYLPDLDPSARDLFQWLRKHKGLATMREVREYTESSGIKLYKLAETLASYGLAFTTFKEQEHVLFIPQDFYASLGRNVKPKARAVLSEPEALPTDIKPAETVILNDMATVIGAVYQQKIEPTQAGRVPKRVATKLRPRLNGAPRLSYEGEDSYIEAVLQSATQLGLVQLLRSPIPDINPYFTPGPKIASWPELSLAEQSHAILQQWLTQPLWRDIAGSNFSSQYSYGLQIQPGRVAIIEQLKKCAPERWYSIESLLHTIWSNDPLAMRHESPYVYKAELLKIQARQKEYKNWREADGEVYIGMLSHVLYELGLVSLGYNNTVEQPDQEPINPDAFQVSKLGAAVMALHRGSKKDSVVEEREEQEERERLSLIVQPSFEMLLMQQDFATLYQLLPFAQLDQVGMVSRLTLTRNSILHGLEHGYNVERILQILAEHSQKEIPQNVAYTLNDWAKAFQEAKISQVLLLEVSSEATATQLCGMRKLQEYNIRQVAPCLVLISSDINLQTLRNLLEKEGIKAQLNGTFHTGR